MPLSKKRNNLFLWLFLSIGLTVQAVTFFIADESLLSLVCGALGICSVVLCSQGNILTFFFGFAQVITYSIICYQQQLYGTLAINGYYFVTQIYGVYAWRKRILEERTGVNVGPTVAEVVTKSVPTRKLSCRVMALIFASLAIVSVLTGWLLATFTNDSHPYLDACTTIPALVAQVLMILAYREQWYIWFLIDVLYVVLWARVGDWCLFAQHVFWCINCVYGYINWSKTLQEPA